MMEIMLLYDYFCEFVIYYFDLLGGKDFEIVFCNGQYRVYWKNCLFGLGVYKVLYDIRFL